MSARNVFLVLLIGAGVYLWVRGRAAKPAATPSASPASTESQVAAMIAAAWRCSSGPACRQP